jgi:hypothetical protein
MAINIIIYLKKTNEEEKKKIGFYLKKKERFTSPSFP